MITGSTSNEPFLEQLFRIIEDNLDNEQFGVEELAKELGLSRTQLHRKLHQINGKSASQVIREYRLEKAKEILENEGLTSAEVAYKVGFNSPSYFNTCFNDFYGYSPGEAKNRNIIQKKNAVTANKNKLWMLFGGIIILVSIYFALYSSGILKNNKIQNAEAEKTIAVRPFWSESTKAENVFFVNGITEDIRNNLSKISGIRIPPRGALEKYRDIQVSTRDIAIDLNATHVLEGTVQRLDNELMIHVQLIITDNEDIIWQETFRANINDVKEYFDMQSQIAQTIAEELSIVLTLNEIQRIDKIPTENLVAYDFYLKGKEYSFKGSRSDLNQAIYLFNQALDLDQEFAQAYVELGLAYFRQAYWSDFFKKSFGDSLLNFANKALSINPELEQGYWLRARYFYIISDHDKSINDLEKAIKLNPNFGDAYRLLGENYKQKGFYGDGFKFLKMAVILKKGEPDYSDVLDDLGGTYYAIGDYKKSEIVLNEVLKFNPIRGYLMLNWINKSRGDLVKCKYYVDQLCQIDSGFSCYNAISDYFFHIKEFHRAHYYDSMARIEISKQGLIDLYGKDRAGYILWNLGRKNEAIKALNEQIDYCKESITLKRPYARSGSAYFDLASVYAFLGNKDQAYRFLESNTITGIHARYLQVYPAFVSLRNDEKFVSIIQQYEDKFARIRNEIDSLEIIGIIPILDFEKN